MQPETAVDKMSTCISHSALFGDFQSCGRFHSAFRSGEFIFARRGRDAKIQCPIVRGQGYGLQIKGTVQAGRPSRVVPGVLPQGSSLRSPNRVQREGLPPELLPENDPR